MIDTLEIMASIIYKQLPNLLRKYRKVRGLKQRDVARILRLGSKSISHWEKGRSMPTLVNAIRLAHLYRVMVDALFDDLVRMLREEVRSRENSASQAGKSLD